MVAETTRITLACARRAWSAQTIQSEARYVRCQRSGRHFLVLLLTNNAQYDGRYKVGQSIIMQGLGGLCVP